MKSTLTLLVAILAFTAHGKEQTSLSKEDARKVIEYFRTAGVESRVILWCGCCKRDNKQELLVKYISYRRTEGSDRYEFTLAGKIRSKHGTDLFYEAVDPANVWVVKSGVAQNLSTELGTVAPVCAEPFIPQASLFSPEELANPIVDNSVVEKAIPPMALTTRSLIPGMASQMTMEPPKEAEAGKVDIDNYGNGSNEKKEADVSASESYLKQLMSGVKPTYTYVEKMPVPGFDVPTFLKTRLHYPAIAVQNNIEGRVTLRFVVDEDGFVTNVETVSHPNIELEEEAKRVVQMMPPWTPGSIEGKNVKVFYILPISFRLSHSNK